MPTTNLVMKARSRVGVAARWGTPAEQADAKRELKTALLQSAIEKALSEAPPLTTDQRAQLAALLTGGGR